jgi:hypothetical protein
LEVESCFVPRLAWTTILLFYTSCCGWDDSCTQPWNFFHRDGVSQTNCPTLPVTMILLISAWDDRHALLKLAIGWDGVALTFAGSGFKPWSSQPQPLT